MKEEQNKDPNSFPAYMHGWKSEKDTIAEFRKLKPTFHKTTLGRMRLRKEVVAIKFAGSWFYKPETALQIKETGEPPINLVELNPPEAA